MAGRTAFRHGWRRPRILQGMAHYLVVAHQTADSQELIEAVRAVVDAEADAAFTLLVPATPVDHLSTWTEGGARAVAASQAERARAALEDAGVSVAEVQIGDGNPLLAVRDALLAHPYDAVVVSTFPLKKSRWLRANLVEKLERAVDVPITHVVAHSRG